MIRRVLLTLVLLAEFSAEASAGPILNRIREKREARKVQSAPLPSAPKAQATPIASAGWIGPTISATSSCANGRCAIPK